MKRRDQVRFWACWTYRHANSAVPAHDCPDAVAVVALPTLPRIARVDDRRVLSSIIYVIRNGLQPNAGQRNTPNLNQGRLSSGHLKTYSKFHHVDGRDPSFHRQEGDCISEDVRFGEEMAEALPPPGGPT